MDAETLTAIISMTSLTHKLLFVVTMKVEAGLECEGVTNNDRLILRLEVRELMFPTNVSNKVFDMSSKSLLWMNTSQRKSHKPYCRGVFCLHTTVKFILAKVSRLIV